MTQARTGILYCIDALPSGGGTENQLAGLLRRLDRRRYDLHLCTLRRAASQPELPGVSELRLDVPGMGRPAGWRGVARLASYLRERRIAIVQSFFQDATVVAALASRLAGVPVRAAAFRDLGFWRSRRQELRMRLAYRLLTDFVANSEAVRSHFCATDGLTPARVAVIPNGVSPEDFPFAEHPEAATAAVGIVGNLNRPVKRTDLFLEAAALAARDRPQVTWHVVGDGSLRRAYEAQAAALDLGDRVVFAGRVADMSGYLRRLAVGVICSDSEGFSNAVLEYMLSGTAVVATDVGGNREVIRHGETGLLVPPGDAGALGAAVGRLLDDPAGRDVLARRARAEVAARFGWERCVAAHEALYARWLREAGVTAPAEG